MWENSCGVQNEDWIPLKQLPWFHQLRYLTELVLQGTNIWNWVEPNLLSIIKKGLEFRHWCWGALRVVLVNAAGIPCHFGITWAQQASASAVENIILLFRQLINIPRIVSYHVFAPSLSWRVPELTWNLGSTNSSRNKSYSRWRDDPSSI